MKVAKFIILDVIIYSKFLMLVYKEVNSQHCIVFLNALFSNNSC
jgi:hypothetical protein